VGFCCAGLEAAAGCKNQRLRRFPRGQFFTGGEARGAAAVAEPAEMDYLKRKYYHFIGDNIIYMSTL